LPDAIMSYHALEEGSALLRLEIYAAKVVHQHGSLALLRVVFAAWWNRPRLPVDMAPRLWADMGLPPEKRPVSWPGPRPNPQIPLIVWWPGL
jgi:hypothetical protein